MQAKNIIILALLVVYIATSIMARRLSYDASNENTSLEQRQANLRQLLRQVVANKRRVRF